MSELKDRSTTSIDQVEGTRQFDHFDAVEDASVYSRPEDRKSWGGGMFSSFKRAQHDVPPGADWEMGTPQVGDTSKLHRKLKGRHIQMIAIGGSIGAGLFLGSGSALATGGPGSLVLDFAIVGVILFCTVNALGELATLFPVQGTFISSQF
jgi:amino acid permease